MSPQALESSKQMEDEDRAVWRENVFSGWENVEPSLACALLLSGLQEITLGTKPPAKTRTLDKTREALQGVLLLVNNPVSYCIEAIFGPTCPLCLPALSSQVFAWKLVGLDARISSSPRDSSLPTFCRSLPHQMLQHPVSLPRAPLRPPKALLHHPPHQLL